MNAGSMMRGKPDALSGRNRPIGISNHKAGGGRLGRADRKAAHLARRDARRGQSSAGGLPGRGAAMRDRFRGEAAKSLQTGE